jgi:hypothetical protein
MSYVCTHMYMQICIFRCMRIAYNHSYASSEVTLEFECYICRKPFMYYVYKRV